MLYVDLFDSEAIAKFAYDLTTRSLVIFFKSGSVYEYPSVPQEIFEGLRSASSKGQYFHRSIRQQFAGRVLSPSEIAGFALATGPGATRTARNGVLIEIASLERHAGAPVFF
jgi:KTSC domain